jgi:hypothetical protein
LSEPRSARSFDKVAYLAALLIRPFKSTCGRGSVENLCFGGNTFEKGAGWSISMHVWTDARAGLRQVRRVFKQPPLRRFAAYSGQPKVRLG